MNLKKLVKAGWKFATSGDYRFSINADRGVYDDMPDEEYLKRLFKARVGYPLNLDNPQTFNEKLQWLKLHDRNPRYTELVDKYEVRRHIAATIGQEHLIELVGGPWDRFDDIDFDELPQRFVLKCTHDSGGLVICKDKSKLDKDAARKKIEKSLRRNYYLLGREWPYKNVKHRIIAEAYMEDTEGKDDLTDYKIYCFNGEVKVVMIATDRFTGNKTHFNYVDRDFNWLDMEWGHPRSEKAPEKPALFEALVATAQTLSAGIPHVRVDLYVVEGKIYFGEMTFFDGSGLQAIEPYAWDLKMGSWIELPPQK